MRILGQDLKVVQAEGTTKSIGAYGRWLFKEQIIQIAGDLSEEQYIYDVTRDIGSIG